MDLEQEKVKEVHERILFEAEGLKLPCSKAFAIASEVKVPVAEVGKICNETGIKIVSCQLGCF
ncbi:MAG: hypothetical protein ACNA7Z_05090 [Dethiobacteria bacterium]|nr:hypothetical protein [Bacillota bacterium]MDW7729099.1 hypothetical protein [Bacillota bacterium]